MRGIIPARPSSIPLRVNIRHLIGVGSIGTGATATAGRPEMERAAAPSPNIDGATTVLSGIARGVAAGAGGPVLSVDLPDSNIIGGWATVEVGCMSIATALMRDDASALILIPTRESRA